MRTFSSSPACAKYWFKPLNRKTLKISFMCIHLIFNNNFPDTTVRDKLSNSIKKKKYFVGFHKDQRLRIALQVLLDLQMNCSRMKQSNLKRLLFHLFKRCKKYFQKQPSRGFLRKSF